MVWKGVVTLPGKALGRVVRIGKLPPADPEEKSALSREETLSKVDEALEETSRRLRNLSQRFLEEGKKVRAELLEVQNFMLSDKTFRRAVRQEIEAGYSAEASVERSIRAQCALLEKTGNAVLNERVEDIRDVGNRVVCRLRGIPYPDLASLSGAAILAAEEIPPSLLADADQEKVRGILLAKGSKTSHVAILASNMGIPMIVGFKEVDSLRDGEEIYLDAVSGNVHTRLTEEEIRKAEEEIEAYRQKQLFLDRYLRKDAYTADGTRIYVLANLLDSRKTDQLMRIGSDGVGLFRTEFLYMNREQLPGEEEQFAVFRDVAKKLDGLPLTIRTMDIGGDKKVKAVSPAQEANPVLGFRAVRICLGHPELMLAQRRAALRASAFGKVKIMFPMISSLNEVEQCLELFGRAKESLRSRNIDFDAETQTGIMVEIPSAALIADRLAKRVDFFSIGSNDLTQYTLAADRTTEKVANGFNSCHPAVLRLIGETVAAAEKEGKSCSLCGEMGADPLAVPLLLGLGLRRFSVNPSSIPLVRHLVSQCALPRMRELAQAALRAGTAEQVKEMVTESVGREYREWL